MIRIAHATDLHFTCPPPPSRLFGKRVLGTANLYLGNRRSQFSARAQAAAVHQLLALKPDVCVITGDITTQSLPGEFAKAHNALQPVLAAIPSVVLAGNHDVYTWGAYQTRRPQHWFGAHMHQGPSGLGRFDVGELTVLSLDGNRPTWFSSSGRVPGLQLAALATALADPKLAHRTVVLALHYPLVDRHGALYDSARRGLINAGAVIRVLAKAPKQPALVMHGHEHRGYRATIQAAGTSIPTVNCGSSGYAYLPNKGRTAALAVYTLDRGAWVHTERYLFDGERFCEEPGGAFSATTSTGV